MKKVEEQVLKEAVVFILKLFILDDEPEGGTKAVRAKARELLEKLER